ncbi:MAG: HEPN domain-containing protein [Candidatus Abyssobacteria bacterium SURF_5]|uniref:HEPN domain-containing protein n=1 Tax=Abyssobacteria bacterium (strain SURF_5) TaxID=2093360 RepID=A0A3A4NRP7_ABYX5|nr:MAG: HEPN domain-containing protein [Candidatus Abyssubacteria bacterium SURF_5]
MRPPEDIKRKLIAEWLRKADSDTDLAEHLMAEGAAFANSIAFHSQQAAEKYLKAFLTSHQVAFPKTHERTVGSCRDLQCEPCCFIT